MANSRLASSLVAVRMRVETKMSPWLRGRGSHKTMRVADKFVLSVASCCCAYLSHSFTLKWLVAGLRANLKTSTAGAAGAAAAAVVAAAAAAVAAVAASVALAAVAAAAGVPAAAAAAAAAAADGARREALRVIL